MPTRQQIIADAIAIFTNARFPGGQNASTAWLGIYQTLLWYESVHQLLYTELPHIIDADKLRPKKLSGAQPGPWQIRADALNSYLSQQIGCSPASVSNFTDGLMKHPSYQGLQRQNPLGIAFTGLVQYALQTFGAGHVLYETEVDAGTIFSGVTVPGRSNAPSIDLLASSNGIPAVIISAKWSLRHDRLNDITNECPVYKAAYQRIYRQTRRKELRYYVITNEYDPSRLSKVLSDSCIDGVVHVHKSAVIQICGLNGRLGQLTDLQDFIAGTSTW